MAFERPDGRKHNELRPITAKVGVIKNARGSAYFKIGKTASYAAVYGPRELHPKFLQNPKTGKLRFNYNMMPFSGQGDRVRPGPSRRSKEISMVSEHALNTVMDLRDFPNAVVDVFTEQPQTDAGSRCASICAAAMALADAGFKMKDLPVAVAVGHIDGNVIADLSYEEEAFPAEKVADIAMCMLPRTGEISLLQMDGETDVETLQKSIELMKEVSKEISKVMQDAITAPYKEA